MSHPAAEQLAEALHDHVGRLVGLLGVDAYNLAAQIELRAEIAVAQLRSDHGRLAAETAQSVLKLLWGDCPVPDEWWPTPLGRLVAQSYGMPGAEAVSMSVAAARLGVSKTWVQKLADAGRLDRHPDGGITVVSVAQMLTP